MMNNTQLKKQSAAIREACLCGNGFDTVFWDFCTQEGEIAEWTDDEQLPSNYVMCNTCNRIWYTEKGVPTLFSSKPYPQPKRGDKLRVDQYGQWTCFCGNEAWREGFHPCNPQGAYLESDESEFYVCDRCGSIIDDKTARVVGFRQES